MYIIKPSIEKKVVDLLHYCIITQLYKDIVNLSNYWKCHNDRIYIYFYEGKMQT